MRTKSGKLVIADVSVLNAGSVCIVTPKTDEARTWIEDNVQDDAQRWGGGIVVEPRHLADLLAGMVADGLVVA